MIRSLSVSVGSFSVSGDSLSVSVGAVPRTKRTPGPLPGRTLSHRPYLDDTHAGHGAARRNRDRLVQILHVDQHVAAKVLARLCERPIRQEPLAVAHSDARRGR